MRHLTIILPALVLGFALNGQVSSTAQAGRLGILAPTNGTVLDTSLTAVLRWRYPAHGTNLHACLENTAPGIVAGGFECAAGEH